MTEPEWRASSDPLALAYYLNSRSVRKRRLLACACARRVLHLLTDPVFAAAVDAAEQFADGELSWEELKTGPRKAATDAAGLLNRGRSRVFLKRAAWAAAVTTSREGCGQAAAEARAATAAWAGTGEAEESARQADLLRDIYGNPFKPVTFDPGWRSDTVVALARGMYDARDFGIMPILADALDDAGCDQPDLLAHCRDPHQAHARGCWAVDLVLGKS